LSPLGASTPEATGTAESPDTPAVRQFWAAKRSHPDCVVLFRMGDFFEIFGEDAERSAPILGVALTSRAFGKAGRIAMCGVPHHSLEPYARKLLDAGIKLAICDQVETPRPGKLVARRVVRVLTAGTLIEDGFLAPGATARCVVLYQAAGRVGLAALDVSTGSCQLGSIAGGLTSPQVGYQLAALEAAEVVLPAEEETPPGIPANAAVTRRPMSAFNRERGRALLHASSGELAGESDDAVGDPALAALGALADYCAEGELALDPAFLRVTWRTTGATMNLDASTRRNLELTQGSSGGPSLFRLIDRTLTPTGGRRLRGWLQEPFSRLPDLLQRQQSVAEMAREGSMRAQVRAALSTCRDMERLLGRCVQSAASPRDLANLMATLDCMPELVKSLTSAESSSLAALRADLADAPAELSSLLSRALADDPPALARDGGFIRVGFDTDLDQIREASSGAREYLSKLEETERQRTGIKGLRVGYNRVFGYYIEIRNASRDQIPAEYVRRQTLVGAERYVTSDLREHENVVLTARDRAVRREMDCLDSLIAAVCAQASAIGQAAAALGESDAIQALAETGVEQGWVMPTIDETVGLELVSGRHPLVEAALPAGRFVPNDVSMDGESERVWLLTGPNMAGKSTFLRQVASICLLGQVGSMVPCARARWGLVDRIFTRVGAQDDIAAGRSTFMVEMEEMALILSQSSARSLLILDEIGRGTSTYDGMSIAQAVLEFLHDHSGMARRVLFATHYHELTSLERSLAALRNFRVEVIEGEDGGEPRITFLHQIVAGGADRSYGINVAQLAGLPKVVLDRAAEVLARRESDRPLGSGGGQEHQLSLPLSPPHPVMVELESLQVDGMTPLQALEKIAEWQRQAGQST
jgi:DNA mismatch repair protein MutS